MATKKNATHTVAKCTYGKISQRCRLEVFRVPGELRERTGTSDTYRREIVYCPTHAAAPELLAALEALANVYFDEARGYRCQSCSCEIAPEGYCGCKPLRNEAENARLCNARAAIREARGE